MRAVRRAAWIALVLVVVACGDGDDPVVGVDQIPPLESFDPAELADISTIGAQEGLTLEESVARYGWRDDFAMAVQLIRETHPGSVADAAIEDGASAWVRFAAAPPAGSRALIDDALAGFPYVVVTIESDLGVSSEQANDILVAAYRAVFERADVDDAVGAFDVGTRTVTITVASPPPGRAQASLEELEAAALEGIRRDLGDDAVELMAVEVVRSPLTSLSEDD
ncbi:MAG: hypothetical protein AAGA90_18600 [Actinomycetota bacterium]